MRYYLKKDLPGIKAGTEMEKWTNEYAVRWHPKNAPSEKLYIPPSELSDWIEKRHGMWKLKKDECYYIPRPDKTDKNESYYWCDDELDNWCLSCGLVCSTRELAIELADRQIETNKKFWEEKK